MAPFSIDVFRDIGGVRSGDKPPCVTAVSAGERKLFCCDSVGLGADTSMGIGSGGYELERPRIRGGAADLLGSRKRGRLPESCDDEVWCAFPVTFDLIRSRSRSTSAPRVFHSSTPIMYDSEWWDSVALVRERRTVIRLSVADRRQNSFEAAPFRNFHDWIWPSWFRLWGAGRVTCVGLSGRFKHTSTLRNRSWSPN